jgi:hypothetical protein
MKRLKEIFLHIGPHKTGTSAIQRMADENRAALARRGILYPRGRWHGQLGSCFAQNKLAYVYNRHSGFTDLAEIDRSDNVYKARLVNELEDSYCQYAILSYEGFIDLSPDEVGKLINFLRGHCDGIRVIAYCRHPLSFAPSEISQRARMGFPCGRQDRENPPIPKFKSYFEKFAKVLGTERLILSDFSRAVLYKGDVRLDFLNKIGFPDRYEGEINLSKDVTNESLSAEALMIADAMAKSLPGLAHNNLFFRRYDSFLSAIEGAPIRLSQYEKELVMTASRPHLEYLQKTFDMELIEPEKKSTGEVELFSRSTIKSLALELRRLIDYNTKIAALPAVTPDEKSLDLSDFQSVSELGVCQINGRELTLTALANQFGSDKGTKVGAPPHRYTYLYDLIFWPVRELPINFLEVGLAIGGPEVAGPTERKVSSPSVQMWLSYFPNAHIFGFDISDFSHIKDPRFIFIRGDAGSEADLRQVANAAPKFDVIIDDASHASYHQQLTFKVLFPKLAPGGIYIIEDLQWQSPAFEDILPKVPKTSAFFQNFFETGKYIENLLLSTEEMQRAKESLSSFASFGAFDGSRSPTKLIVMRKALYEDGARVTSDQVKTPACPGIPSDPPPVIQVDDVINAAYKAVLARSADPRGLEAYRKVFKEVAFPVGLERTLNALLKSKEYQGKQVVQTLSRVSRIKEIYYDNRARILFMQTADSKDYRSLLEITSENVESYCCKHDFDYMSYAGIVRGYYPWHATFNRIPLLHSLATSGFSGWVCYLDADAFVADLSFDLRVYLESQNDTALIAAPVGQSFWWAVNAGVLLLNLGHPLGRDIARNWYRAFSAITDDELRAAVDWSTAVDDQNLLHQVLRATPNLEKHMVVDRAHPSLINYEGRFIKQVLRADGSFEQRKDRLRAEVTRGLGRVCSA